MNYKFASVNEVEDPSRKIPNINTGPPHENTHMCAPHIHIQKERGKIKNPQH